jgi:hypothetical protein
MERDNDAKSEVEGEQKEELSAETLELLAREVDLNALPAGLLD